MVRRNFAVVVAVVVVVGVGVAVAVAVAVGVVVGVAVVVAVVVVVGVGVAVVVAVAVAVGAVMELLPLYPEPPRVAVETVRPLDRDASCRRCGLAVGVRTPCMGAEVSELGPEPRTVLLVGEYPTSEDDRAARPFFSVAGARLRAEVGRHWQGTVVLDNAAKCAGPAEAMERAVDRCRPYLAGVLAEAKPERIVALGARAAQGLLGRTVPPFSVRRGYAWVADIPVFLLMAPIHATRNRFIGQWFSDDLAWALTVPTQDLKPMPVGAVAYQVDDVEDAEEAARHLGDGFTLDGEWAGRMFGPEFRMLCWSATAFGGRDTFVWTDAALKDPAARGPMDRLLRAVDVPKAGQNIKADLLAYGAAFGVLGRGVDFDTMVVRKLLEAHADADLETLAELVGMGGHKDEAKAALRKAEEQLGRAVAEGQGLLPGIGMPPPSREAREDAGRGDGKRHAFALVPGPVLRRYNARDSLSTELLREALSARLAQSPEATKVWRELARPAVEAVAQMELWGIGVDRLQADALEVYLANARRGVEARLHGGGHQFNPASNDEVAAFLYDDLKLPPVLTYKGNRSVDKEALKDLRGRHPVVNDILEWRHLEHLRGTYATDGMMRFIRGDGRLHPDFQLAGTRTGRMSSKNPNCLNTPRADTVEGKLVKDVFRAPNGNVILQMDYSQLELRIAAAMSGDRLMTQAFVDGVDFHQRTAELVSHLWGIKPEQVEKKHRSYAKGVNFLTLYGGTPYGLAASLGCSVDEAEALQEAVLGKFSGLQSWIAARIQETRKTGGSWSWWNGGHARWRALWHIAEQGDGDEAKRQRANAEHSAVNSPVQGTAADFCLASVCYLVNWIQREGFPARLVNSVYDSIIFEVQAGFEKELAAVARDCMVGWPKPAAVPLVVDIETGDSWGSMTALEVA